MEFFPLAHRWLLVHVKTIHSFNTHVAVLPRTIRHLRARRALSQFKDVPLRARRALSLFKDVTLRARRGYNYSKMFFWEPEGRYHHRLCTLITPFWFSKEHLWIVIMPFWLSTDVIYFGGGRDDLPERGEGKSLIPPMNDDLDLLLRTLNLPHHPPIVYSHEPQAA